MAPVALALVPPLPTPDSPRPSWRRGWGPPARGRACAPRAPPGAQHLQAAPRSRIPPRPPSGAAKLPLHRPLPRPGTCRGGGTDAARGSLPAAPQPGGPAPRRAQQAAGTVPRNAGLGGWPRRPVTETGRDGQAPPEQGTGVHRGAERDAWSPGRSHQPGRPPALAARAASELRVSLAARGPDPPLRRGRALTRGRRPTSPVPDAQGPRSLEEEKKDAAKGTRLSQELATFRNPPEARPAAAARPAGGTAGGGGAQAGEARAGRPRVPARTLKKSLERQALDSQQRPVPSCQRRASPDLPALGPEQPGERGVPARPPPPPPRGPAPPRPRPLHRPEVGGGGAGGGGARGGERGDRDRTCGACRPRPGPNQASCGGVRRAGGGRGEGTRPPGSREGGEPREVGGPGRPRPVLAREGCRRAGTPCAPSPGAGALRGSRAPLPGARPPPARSGWPGWLFGLSIISLIRNDGGQATHRRRFQRRRLRGSSLPVCPPVPHPPAHPFMTRDAAPPESFLFYVGRCRGSQAPG